MVDYICPANGCFVGLEFTNGSVKQGGVAC